MIKLISPADNSEVSILTDIQKEFIKRERPLKNDISDLIKETEAYPWYSEAMRNSPGATAPASLIFKWKISDPLCNTAFELSLDPNFAPSERAGRIASIGEICFSAEDGTYFVVVDNLLSGTTYYWRVTTAEATSEIRTFSTVLGEIRTIRADGMDNVRDIGGRITADGRRIKQGLIYRGCALNGLITPECAGKNGLRVMRDDLAIKTDIDLRCEAVGKYEFCPLGDHINYILIPLDAYGGTLNDKGRSVLKKIFEFLADETNYPIYFHCIAGADRTGTVAFLLDALLGMSAEDIVLNYNLTALCDTRSWYHTSDMTDFMNFLNEEYPGHTIPELLMIHLRSTGLSEETICRIRNNLLE